MLPRLRFGSIGFRLPLPGAEAVTGRRLDPDFDETVTLVSLEGIEPSPLPRQGSDLPMSYRDGLRWQRNHKSEGHPIFALYAS